jgi:hypothetical protein|nr:MAG TPA: hypothetical protein [Caudoviricetes sp.]
MYRQRFKHLIITEDDQLMFYFIVEQEYIKALLDNVDEDYKKDLEEGLEDL